MGRYHSIIWNLNGVEKNYNVSGKIKELDADLVIMVLDYIKVYESGRLTIRFFDGTEFECETE